MHYRGRGQMEIYLIRHAQTAKNKAKVLQGRSNAPLNEEGREQSRRAAAFFAGKGIQFDRIYTSPLIRCVQTAQIVAGGKELLTLDGNDERITDRIISDERLLEMDYGPYEGMSLEAPPPEIIHFFSDFVHNKEPEGMESLDSVKERLRGFLQSIAYQPWESVLIATHAIAMKGALEVLTPDSGGSYWSKYIGNCAVYHSNCSSGRFSIPEEIYESGGEPGI